jgi:hypothetical protein
MACALGGRNWPAHEHALAIADCEPIENVIDERKRRAGVPSTWVGQSTRAETFAGARNQ